MDRVRQLVHELLVDIFTNETIIQLFTKMNDMLKQRLRQRLMELNVVNDGGPQHAYDKKKLFF